VAFASTRGGGSDIWLANLDQPDGGRFANLSESPLSTESNPTWSPDGEWLAWGSSGGQDAFGGVYVLETGQLDLSGAWGPVLPAQRIASGDLPAWGSSGNLAARFVTPNSNALTAYDRSGNPVFVPIPFASEIYGIDWRAFHLPSALPPGILEAATAGTAPLYASARSVSEGLPPGRVDTVPLEEVQAPYPELHDDVDEAFAALRQRVTLETNWDALASLENAFIPLTTALEPGLGQDWLYTGRAFALNTLSLGAGWMRSSRGQRRADLLAAVFATPGPGRLAGRTTPPPPLGPRLALQP
jgi:hypothetical protein